MWQSHNANNARPTPVTFRTTPDTNQKQRKQPPQHTFYSAVKPLLFILTTFGKLPILRNSSSDDFVVRLESEAMIYAAIVYTLEVAIVSYVYYKWYSVLESVETYDNVLLVVLILFALQSNFNTPLTYWRATAKVADYLNRWKQFEDEYLSVVGLPITLNLRRASLLLGPFVIAVMAVASLILRYLIILYHWTDFLALYITGCTSLCTLAIWAVNCAAIAKIASDFSKQLLVVLKDNPSTQHLEQWRQLWISLHSLTQQLGSSMSVVCLNLLLTNHILFILACYGAISHFFDRGLTHYTVGVTFITAFAGFIIFIICDSGHRVAEKVGPGVSNSILHTSLITLNVDVRQQVIFLLQEIELSPSDIRFCGILTVNRSLFIKVLSTTVTYMVVLLQFRTAAPLSSTSNQPNISLQAP